MLTYLNDRLAGHSPNWIRYPHGQKLVGDSLLLPVKGIEHLRMGLKAHISIHCWELPADVHLAELPHVVQSIMHRDLNLALMHVC